MKNKIIAVLFFLIFSASNLFSADDVFKILRDAQIYFDNGLYVKSLELAESVLKINPNFKECHNLIGLIYQKTDNSDSAEYYFKKSIFFDSNYRKSLYDLANLYMFEDRFDSALALITQALKTEPKNPEYISALMKCYLELNNVDKFLSGYELMEKIHPDYSISKYLYAKYIEKTGKTEEAKKYYFEAAKREYLPFIPEPYVSLANLYLKENNIPEAKNFYEEAMKYPKTEKTALIQLAKIYNSSEQYDKTIKLWEMPPSYYLNAYHIGAAYYYQAMILLSDDRIDPANNLLERSLFYFKSALRLNPDDELTRNMIEKILLRTSPVNSAERKEFAEFRKLNGLYFLYDNGKTDEALLELYKSIRLNPQDVQNRLELAKFYQKRNLVQSAISEYERIMDINAADLYVKDNLELLKYNYESMDPVLSEFIKGNQTSKKNALKIAVKISSKLYSIQHSNIAAYFEETFQNLSGLNLKFEFYYVPVQFEEIENIEQYARTINADGIVIINLFENDNKIKTSLKIYSITGIKKNAVYSVDRIRRGLDLTVNEDKLVFEGKNKLLRTAVSVFNKINSNFDAIGTVRKLLNYKVIVNLGILQGVKKTDKLKVVSRQADKDIIKGEIIVSDINENYCICQIKDMNVLNSIKAGDVSYITK